MSNLPIDQGTFCLQTLASLATQDAPFSITGRTDGYFRIAVGDVAWMVPNFSVEILMAATIGISAGVRAKDLK